MKKLFTILVATLAIFSSDIISAQAPQGFNYQAVIRNSSGNPVVNQDVTLKFKIIQGQPTSTPVFTEQHTLETDDLGTVNLIIGEGSQLGLTQFNEINWALGSYHLGIEINIGQGFVEMGTTQLLSVPYALYAESSGFKTTVTVNLNNYDNNSIKLRYLLIPEIPENEENYLYCGVLVGTSEYVSLNDNITNIEDWEFWYSSDLYFDEDNGYQPNTTYYFLPYVVKGDNTIIYGNVKEFTSAP